MKLVYVCLSGVLLVLAFPKINIEWIAFIGLVPLLLAIDNQRCLTSFVLSFITGIIFFGIFLSWMAGVKLYQVPQVMLVIGWLCTTIACALFIGIFGLCMSITGRLNKHVFPFNIFLPGCIWTALEFIRSCFPMSGFPWGILGYSQYQNIYLIQIAEFTGVFGISFVILLVNYSIAMLIKDIRCRTSWYGVLLTCIILSGCYVWGNTVLKHYDISCSTRQVKIAIIQSNIGINTSWEWTSSYKDIISILDRLTQEVITSQASPDMIIYPETVILTSPSTSIWMRDILVRLSKKTDSYILIGAPHVYDQNDQVRYYNSAFLISSQGIVDRYDKIHLVPFGEMVPGERLCPWLRRLFPQAGQYSSGDKVVVFHSPAKFSTLICYEGIFGNLTRRFVNNGAEFIVNITNDAWTRTDASYYQHFSMGIFRAVENRRYFVRAGNTGISGIINPVGKVKNILGIGKEGVIIDTISLCIRPTFYSLYGDVFAYICLGISIIVVVLSLCKLLINKRYSSCRYLHTAE
jgi:apolipoprotein N-acyltransferase